MNSAERGFFAIEAGASRPGKSIQIRGYQLLVKVSGDDNGGEFAVFEVPALPNTGPPLHMHHIEGEYFYVLDGELDVQVGTEVIRLKAGGSVYLPRMIPHTFQPAGGREARFLSFVQPAGRVEAFGLELSNLLQKGPLDPVATKALFGRHGMDVVGPPLPSRA